MVREGEGVGLLYSDSVEQGVKAGQFKILNVIGVNFAVIGYILYSREKALSRDAQKFLRVLRGVTNNVTSKGLLRAHC